MSCVRGRRHSHLRGSVPPEDLVARNDVRLIHTLRQRLAHRWHPTVLRSGTGCVCPQRQCSPRERAVSVAKAAFLSPTDCLGREGGVLVVNVPFVAQTRRCGQRRGVYVVGVWFLSYARRSCPERGVDIGSSAFLSYTRRLRKKCGVDVRNSAFSSRTWRFCRELGVIQTQTTMTLASGSSMPTQVFNSRRGEADVEARGNPECSERLRMR